MTGGIGSGGFDIPGLPPPHGGDDIGDNVSTSVQHTKESKGISDEVRTADEGVNLEQGDLDNMQSDVPTLARPKQGVGYTSTVQRRPEAAEEALEAADKVDLEGDDIEEQVTGKKKKSEADDVKESKDSESVLSSADGKGGVNQSGGRLSKKDDGSIDPDKGKGQEQGSGFSGKGVAENLRGMGVETGVSREQKGTNNALQGVSKGATGSKESLGSVERKRKNLENVGEKSKETVSRGNVAASKAGGSSVPGSGWLKPSPLTAFMVSFMELQAALKQQKLDDSAIFVAQMTTMMKQAINISNLIKAIGYKEADIYQMQSTMAFTKAAVSLTIAIISAGALMGSGNAMRAAAISQTASGAGSGITSAVEGAEKLMMANMTRTKARMEQEKAVLEGAQKVIDQAMSKSADAIRTSDEMLNQLLQALTKLIDETIRAHDMKVH